MYPSINQIKTVLVQGSYISEADSKAAEEASRDSVGYIEYLIRAELLSKSLLGQALAEGYRLPFADLGTHPVAKEQTTLMPEEVARATRAAIVQLTDDTVTVASDAPDILDVSKLRPLFKGRKLQLAYTLPEYIDAAFNLYQRPLATRFSHIIESSSRVAPEIVDEIVKDAISFRASDIHFEPQAESVEVRFRVDGTLREAGTFPLEYYDNILNRIKVESGMRIDEHLTAQDGALQRHGEGYTTDLRVSLVPTVNGEKVVMRVLSSYVQGFSLADIGLDDAHRQMIEAYAAKPFGMILTTGPTGSGKTTTLYALLKLLNHSGVNVTTIEDPVEYKMPGINQIQVREQSNMTFAKGLRAIVRQDPDIILVGEIRDRETAEISVNAALTGHLLLSTFHANDAATAIPRLVEMGIEPFLLASTLEIVIAQRLVRKICNVCRYSTTAGEAIKEMKTGGASMAHYFRATDTVYAGKGCNVCNGSGYKGRIALFQFLEVTPKMQELILKSPSTGEIEALARKQGSMPMFEDGLEKVRSGLTTVSEVARVVPPPEAA
ncbi:MAG TPA: ATPase, T2SS/T4P/T4SS family [Candidatus Saccharimonadales bacterium]|nr:ATPase, T2SS/T4P/T4SS family [Candidatus Saccharimonadales bacterium]